jgi:hypothetical protein
MTKIAFVVALGTLVASTQAQAKHYGHYGRYLVHRHWQHVHHSVHRYRHYAHKHRRYRRHRDPTYSFALTKTRLPDGQTITVNAPFADRFVGFFRELFDREWRLPEIGCYAAHGHLPLPYGRHPAGEACDVGQQARNVAWRPMLGGRITALAHRWGLTDGCEWRGNPDCGHVQVNRTVATVPAVAAAAPRARSRPRATYEIAWGWPL